MATYNGYERLRAATPSDSPTSVNWQYREYIEWLDDPALTVTGLSEKPSECEVTISLSRDIVRDIKNPGVAGVYTGDGSYHYGRPVLQHSGGLFTLSVAYGHWVVQAGGRGAEYLGSGSAPSQCPADPRAASNILYNEMWRQTLCRYSNKKVQGQTHWSYCSKQRDATESSGISVKCNKCVK